jgi:hypothetical protein
LRSPCPVFPESPRLPYRKFCLATQQVKRRLLMVFDDRRFTGPVERGHIILPFLA